LRTFSPATGDKRKTERLSTLRFSLAKFSRNYWQTMTPVLLSQTTFVNAWYAVAVQLCGGPALTCGVTVTLFEGLKPCCGAAVVIAVPPKY
jgi:hypothetical protein